MAAAIAAALQQSVSRITALSDSRLKEDGPEAFEAFRRAVTQAARGREAPPKQLLGGLDDKEAVLRFLVSFHEVKRTHRRQIVAVMTVLMHEKPWHRALCQAEGLRTRLPEDLEACVAEVPEDEQSAEEADEEQSEEPGLSEEAPKARRSSRVVRSVGSLAEATAKLQQLGFCAVDTDAAIDAFGVLNRSVLWVVQSPETEDDEVLSGLEEKEKVLEFLADFHDRKPKHRARVTGLCVRLMEYETWREAVLATSPSVAATISGMTGLLVTTPEAVAVNLATAAEVAASRGALGAVYIRIVRAKKLPTTSAQHPTPFVRVTVGDRAQRTESCDEALNPRWEASPFVFEVSSKKMDLLLEVQSSDVTGDETFGTVRIPISEVAVGAPKLSSAALSPGGGELEYEALFQPVEDVASASPTHPIPGDGGYKRSTLGTQSVVAGLTAAIWDMDKAHVEDASSWIVSRAGEGSFLVQAKKGLVCPAGHPIDKRKEGMSWRQSLLHGDTKDCDFCHREIQRTETRWRCFHHCDFNVCESCYAANKSSATEN
ncbi:ADPRM [Symbiodinium sp. CCMP2592]|nr:ADPRM [Symbiodinium sp. CCMP2592]